MNTYYEHDGKAACNGPAGEDQEDLLQDATSALPGLASHDVDRRLALGAALFVKRDVDL